MDKRKVIIIDKSSFFREALKNILLSIGNVEIIAEASTGQEFIDLLDIHEPDIVFLDLKMHGMSGIEATKLALAKNSKLNIIGFSSADRQCYIDQMIEAGAKGFLSTSKNNFDVLNEIIANPQKGGFFSVEQETKMKTIF